MPSKPAPPMLYPDAQDFTDPFAEMPAPSASRPLPQERARLTAAAMREAAALTEEQRAELVEAIERGDLPALAENMTDAAARFYTQAFLDAVHTLHYFDEGLPVEAAPEPGVPACDLVPPAYAEALAAAAAQSGLTDALLSHADWSQHLNNTRRRKSSV